MQIRRLVRLDAQSPVAFLATELTGLSGVGDARCLMKPFGMRRDTLTVNPPITARDARIALKKVRRMESHDGTSVMR